MSVASNQSMESPSQWERRRLELGSAGGEVLLTALPPELSPDPDGEVFDAWWALHPEERPVITMHGREVAIPRWQAAYGKNYRFSGQLSEALPLPDLMRPILDWAREHVDERLDGVLMNWYDASLGHYIGAHRDSTIGLVPRTPIVTISFGEERAFRMRPYKEKGFEDVLVGHGDVLVIPWKTNLTYTHEVPFSRRYRGKRISMTLRAFHG